MFLITCPGCDHPHLAAKSDILSMHRTSEGLIGYVRCHDTGATLIHNFTKAATLGAAGGTLDPVRQTPADPATAPADPATAPTSTPVPAGAHAA